MPYLMLKGIHMIPKTIHYCWFGKNPLPKLAKKCISSWKKYCPDYSIIEWNEDNFDINSCPQYVKEAYQEKKWAFVTDYVRLKVVYDNGGIYLDTDVELLKNLNPLLEHDAYFGIEFNNNLAYIATGLGFGATKGTDILHELMEDYVDIPFILQNGCYDITPCPHRNTNIFIKHGFKQTNTEQVIDGKIKIYPTEYFCPLDWRGTKKEITNNTVSIHWFSASWYDQDSKKELERTKIKNKIKQILLKIFGEKLYTKIKNIIKRNHNA